MDTVFRFNPKFVNVGKEDPLDMLTLRGISRSFLYCIPLKLLVICKMENKYASICICNLAAGKQASNNSLFALVMCVWCNWFDKDIINERTTCTAKAF